MVEVAGGERKDCGGEAGDEVVGLGGVFAERGRETVEEVEWRCFAGRRTWIEAAAAHHCVDGAARKHPDSGVEEDFVFGGQFADAVGGGLLEEEVEACRVVEWTEQHAVVARLFGRRRDADDQDVRLRAYGQRRIVRHQDVAACDREEIRTGGVAEDALVHAILQVEERLVGALRGGVREDRQREEGLAFNGVSGQAPALAAAVDHQLAGGGEPFVPVGGADVAPGLEERVDGAAA